MEGIPIIYTIKDFDALTYVSRNGYGCIYSYETGGKVYVGQTRKKLEKRMANHSIKTETEVDVSTSRNGWQNLRIRALVPVSKLDEMESYYITELNSLHPNGWNHTNGGMKGFTLCEETHRKIGEKSKGRIPSEEARRNMSESHKGHETSEETRAKIGAKLKGRTYSEESLRKMSEAKKGCVISEEARRKISEAHKGKPKSEETRRKMSEAKMGVKMSDEARKNMSEAKKGKSHAPLSEETRRKISEAHKGMKASEETRRKISEANRNRSKETLEKMARTKYIPVAQYTKDGEYIATYESVKKATEVTGTGGGSICKCAKGKMKSAGGFIWKYVNKVES